jgi:hypothetical protein
MGGIVPVALIATVLVRYGLDILHVCVESPTGGGDQPFDRAEAGVAHPPRLDPRDQHLLHPSPGGELALAEIGSAPHASQQHTEIEGFHGSHRSRAASSMKGRIVRLWITRAQGRPRVCRVLSS